MNDLQFDGRYQCLPIRCSGRLISLHNEHSIYVTEQSEEAATFVNSIPEVLGSNLSMNTDYSERMF
jgi:hypothetical protein